MKKQAVFHSAILLLFLSLLASCGGKTQKTVSTLNSDVLHTENGFMLLERKHYGLAKKEFDKATNYNKKYSRAYMGKAVVFLYQNMLNEAHEELQKALKYAKTKDDILKVKSGLIQFYSSPEFVGRHHGKNAWLILAKQEFDDANKIGKNNEIYYYMAIAYALDFQFSEALKLLDDVIATNNPFTLRAKEEKSRLLVIEKLSGRYPNSKEIIFNEHLTRGQLAFILTKLLHQQTRQLADKNSSVKLVAKDSLNSRYADSIMKVISMKLSGLGILQDKTFRPNKRVSRAELAYILQELHKRLGIHATNGKSTKFSDVTSSDWFYGSVSFASSQNLLAEQDKLTMEFRPLDEVSTLEALEALDKLLGES